LAVLLLLRSTLFKPSRFRRLAADSTSSATRLAYLVLGFVAGAFSFAMACVILGLSLWVSLWMFLGAALFLGVIVFLSRRRLEG